MNSNFNFLKNDVLTADYYPSAVQAEKSYALGLYAGEKTSIRVVAENVARDIADQHFLNVNENATFNDVLHALKYDTDISHDTLELFYNLKQNGNQAAHQLAVMTVSETDKETGLQDLKRLYKLLVWFANRFYGQHIDPKGFQEPTKADYIYTATYTPSAAERNLIYIQSAKTENGHFIDYIGSKKIGKASVTDLAADMSDNSDYLRKTAQKRVKSYMETAGVPSKLEWAELAYRKQGNRHWFNDTDVHKVLENSNIKHSPNLAGREWFLTDLDTAKKAIKAVKNNQKVIETNSNKRTKVVLRPEQIAAVKKTEKAFRNNKYTNMLWNAKMRFGKTLSALQLVKEEKYQHVLIMTHRPAVDESWFDDFTKIGMHEEGYLYGSKNQGVSFNELRKGSKPFIYFASLQDLSGSKMVGGRVKDKNRELFTETWDLVVVDEAHEGTQTELAQQVLSQVQGANTKLLELSGTPFNLLDKYEEDQVYTWDYTMEQQAKQQWEIDHPHEPNPYAGLPRVNMFTFSMNEKFKNPQFSPIGGKSFNFKELFRVNDQGDFVYKKYVEQFLRNITTPSKHTSYPFSTKQFRNQLRHTLWLMPGVKEAAAMERLLKRDPVLGEINGYQIINVVKNVKGEDKGITDQSDVDKVKSAIGKDPASTKTITLTVRKLTTGITIKPWTGVIFLSNTNSAMQYLQAAFRAQTPYSDPHFGTKTDCFIFDFAPDRALTVMAKSVQMNSGVGKITSNVQKQKMSNLLNFLPIIGEQGNRMKPFQVDSMLRQIKKVYAEKAVKSGFEDDSLYSDELLMIKEADLNDFKDLKAIVGKTKREKTKVKVNINDQGLTDEQYDEAINGQKKPKKKRSPEEQAAIEQMNAMKKQRRTLISILRSVSIRIPLMIYGMDMDIAKDISINTFVDKVDEQSWAEFMPDGVDKALFRKFIKYYDPQVFLEAGQLIRKKVKELDNADPIERVKGITDILGTFHNPDRETVLTPWRIVNLHLGGTIGGLSFFDKNYRYATKDGESAIHWVHTNITDRVLNQNSHLLEINSKTGAYPLFAAASIYWREFQKLNEHNAGKFSIEDLRFLWQRVLRENLFMIAKTPMAKQITIRTLAGFQDYDVNVVYVKNLVKDSKDNVKAEAKKIKEMFRNMKFDVVIGNPPYQEVTTKETAMGQKPVQNIFQYFQELADNLDLKYSTLIYPGKRWIHQSGKGLKKFGHNLINDKHLSKLIYFEDASMIFQKVAIPDGITIVFKDYAKNSNIFDYIFIDKNGKKIKEQVEAPGNQLLIVDPRDRQITKQINAFVNKNHLKVINDSPVKNRQLFKIESDFAEKNPDKIRLLKPDSKINYNKEIKLLTNNKAGKAGRATWFIADRNVITSHQELIDEWQVVVSSANAGGQKRDSQIQVIDNHSAFGRSRLALKSFKTEKEANNFLKYATSYLVKFAFLLTDESLTSLGKEVPDLLDYTDSNKFIDYSKDINTQLYTLFGINSDQRQYIQDTIDNLR